jgi:stage IV sporulation protein FB
MVRWLSFLISLLIHEAFHLITGHLLYKRGIRVSLTPAGFRGTWNNSQPGKRAQCLICAAGPLGNISVAVILMLIPIDIEVLRDLARANLFIGVFNLIPLYPMDGGNILLIFLYKYVGSKRTYSILIQIGRVIRIFLLVTGLVLIFAYRNPSLFLAVIFLPETKSIKRSVNRLNLNALIRRKERIIKKRAYRIRHVLMLKDVRLGEAILLLDYDQFHIIHIADENLVLLKEISEKQLIDAIVSKSSDATLEEAFLNDL